MMETTCQKRCTSDMNNLMYGLPAVQKESHTKGEILIKGSSRSVGPYCWLTNLSGWDWIMWYVIYLKDIY